MLVAISDLHFVNGTAGEHNIPYEAFEDIFLENKYVKSAYNENIWKNNPKIQYITPTYDHSPDFVELKQMTYIVFYNKEENTDNKKANTLCFDMWTGIKKKYYEEK